MLAASSGVTRSSASMASTQRPLARSRARCFCAPKPGQSANEKTRAPKRRARSPVSSLLSESTTTHSSANATEARHASMRADSFFVMTMTESRGAGMRRRRRPGHCRQRSIMPDHMTTPPSPLRARLARIAPYFKSSRRGFVIAFFGSVIGALTEPLIPLLLKWLLDKGFQLGGVPLWAVPLAIVGLTVVRGGAGFVAQYGMSWAANRGVMEMRAAMFGRLLDAEPALFTRSTASSLINTLTFEVQNGANQLVYTLQSLIRDTLTVIAMLAVLIYLDWQLTLVVTVMLPAVGFVMRYYSRRLHRFTVEAQKATDDLAYVVEENVLAWKSVRLHAAGRAQSSRFGAVSERLRGVSLKAVIASATMTPFTQVLASCALAAVITAALWQSGQDKAAVGGFVAFITSLLQLIAPIKHLSESS